MRISRSLAFIATAATAAVVLAGCSGSTEPAASEDPALLGAFKTPGLRNITRTTPYFHAGQFDTLDQVVGFYNDTRGHAAPEGQALRIHWHIHMTDGPKLSDATMQDIVAFLGALEDETLRPERPLRLPSGLPPAPAE